MAKNKNNLKDLIDKAVELEDQSERKSGGGDFDYEPPAAGLTVGRLVEYVELGKQPQRPFKGRKKPPADDVRITFELTHPKHVKEVEVDGEKVKIPARISMTMQKSMHEKAKYAKLFDKMQRGRESIKHMAQMLDEAFTITVTHNKSADGKKTYANITDKDGSFLIGAPVQQDIETGETKKLKVPEAIGEIRLFIFNAPTKESWDSLFIDGERSIKKEDGTEEIQSKNFLQNKIKNAVNFPGSAVEQMLEDDGGELDDLDSDETEAEDEVDLEDLEEEGELEEENEELDEEEEDEPPAKAPAKKAVVKAPAKAPVKSVAKKPVAAPATKKSAPAATGKVAAKSAKTASPSKPVKANKQPKATRSDDPLADLGLLD